MVTGQRHWFSFRNWFEQYGKTGQRQKEKAKRGKERSEKKLREQVVIQSHLFVWRIRLVFRVATLHLGRRGLISTLNEEKRENLKVCSRLKGKRKREAITGPEDCS
jgi:hypothetical protein